MYMLFGGSEVLDYEVRAVTKGASTIIYLQVQEVCQAGNGNVSGSCHLPSTAPGFPPDGRRRRIFSAAVGKCQVLSLTPVFAE